MKSLDSQSDDINTQYSLVKHLKLLSENDEKYKNLYASWVIDETVYTNALKAIINSFPHYSMHDSSHSWSIINKIEMVLGENRIKQLSPTDTFLILESAFVHDLGMIISEKEQKKLWNEIEFKKYIEDVTNNNYDKDLVDAVNYIKNIQENGVEGESKDWSIDVKKYVIILNADYIRKRHNYRSADIVMNSNQINILSSRNNLIQERIMRLVAQISIMHGTNFNDILEKLYREDTGVGIDEIHPRMIACLLRLGDLLDLDNGRFNEVLEKTVFMPRTSEEQKEKHQAITHFLVSPKKIEVSAVCSDDNVYRATRKWFDWLQDELKNLSSKWSDIVPDNFIGGPPSLGEIKLSIKDCDLINEQLNFKFKMDSKTAFEFIEGSGIYINKLDCIREVIQNALDATKIQMWNDIQSGKYDSLEECENLNNKLQFSSGIPTIVQNMYPIRIKVNYIEDSSEFDISIEDSGCGITLTDLKRMESVGHSWNEDIEKYKIFEGMEKMNAEWMKPTGSFGIGLHSMFMITDRIEIQTKAENNNAYNITFISSKDNGYISTIVNKERKRNGTKISFKLKSKLIDEFKASKYTRNIMRRFDKIDEELDLVDSQYMLEKRKKKINILLNNYINEINWVKIERQGILVQGDSSNNIIDEKNKFKDIYDLQIKIGVNKSKTLVAKVNDKSNNSEMEFSLLELLPNNIKFDSYSLIRMLNIRNYKMPEDSSKLYYKNIECCDIEKNIPLFKTKLNVVQGQAKQLLSINRNSFIDDSLYDEYISRINTYILKKVIYEMWKYIKDSKSSNNLDEINKIDIVLVFFYYRKYCDGKINMDFLDENEVYKTWKVDEANIINNDRKATLREILLEDKIMLSDNYDEYTKSKAIQYGIKIVLKNSYGKEIMSLLGFTNSECIDENEIYIAYKDADLNEEDIHYIDRDKKELVKCRLQDLFNENKCDEVRNTIQAFIYKNSNDFKIKYLFIEDEEIVSPFSKNFNIEILDMSIDECILKLKECYKFNELIEYVYNNCLDKEIFKNKDYKKVIEDAYRDLILDYIKFVYREDKPDIVEKDATLEVNEIIESDNVTEV